MRRHLAVAVAALSALALAAVGAIVPAGPAGAQYDPMFITVVPTVVPVGGTITVTAGYFEPGSDVEIRVESDPVVLGTLVADGQGVVTSAYQLPISVTIGSHVVFARGPRLGTGVATEVNAAITVIDAGVSPAVTSPPAGTTGSLPVTGASAGPLLAIAAFLVTAGGLLVLARRRQAPS